jgi:hypothetical protein
LQNSTRSRRAAGRQIGGARSEGALLRGQDGRGDAAALGYSGVAATRGEGLPTQLVVNRPVDLLTLSGGTSVAVTEAGANPGTAPLLGLRVPPNRPFCDPSRLRAAHIRGANVVGGLEDRLASAIGGPTIGSWHVPGQFLGRARVELEVRAPQALETNSTLENMRLPAQLRSGLERRTATLPRFATSTIVRCGGRCSMAV